jgi:hypothetical protein
VGPYLSQSCANFYNDLINDNSTEKTDSDEKNQETIGEKPTESHEPENDNEKEEDKGA